MCRMSPADLEMACGLHERNPPTPPHQFKLVRELVVRLLFYEQASSLQK